MSPVRAAAATLALLLLAAPRAAADVFLLRDGTTVEGEVLRSFKDDRGGVDRWEVRTLKGVRILAAAEVRSQKDGGGPWPWRAFEEWFATIDRKDAAELYRSGMWAREKGLEAEAVRAFLRAIEADPDFVRARTALGHQKAGDKWIAPPGQVPVPEERGSPVPPGDAGPLEGALGRVLSRRQTENYRVESTYLDQADLGRYLDTLERARDATLAFLAEPPPPGEVRRPTLLLLKDAAEYRVALDALVVPALEARADREAAGRDLRLYRAGHLAVLPGRPGGCVAWRVDENQTADRAFLAHFAVHAVWRSELPPGARDPDWLAEAVAYAVLNDPFPDDPTYCLATGYGRTDRIPEEWRNTRTWAATARGLASSGKALAFKDLAVLDLNSLSFASLVQSWSVLQALRAKDESGTRAFLRKVRRGNDPFKALQDCLKLDPSGVDRVWRADVLKGR
jgi:hypothetical protein